MTAFISRVVNAEDALGELSADKRRSIYECADGTFAIDHQGSIIGRRTIDELEKRGFIRRRWPDRPELNCWVLR